MPLRTLIFILTEIILLLGGSGSLSLFAEEPKNSNSKQIRVACLGDSITAGNNAKGKTYPNQLQAVLGKGYLVRNFGVGGATLIQTGRPNIWSQLEKVKEFLPQIVIVSLGTNDTVGGKRRNWEQIDRFDSDYHKLLKTLGSYSTHPRILVCTPTAMVLETPGFSDARLNNLKERKPRLEQLVKSIKSIVKKTDVANVELWELYPLLRNRPDLLVPGDGVHPNVEGYQAIAHSVAKGITQPEQNTWKGREATFHGYRQVHFQIAGKKAYIVIPKQIAKGRPWVWRARFPSYHAEIDIALLGKGYHVAYIDVAGLFGSPSAVRIGDQFYQHLTIFHHLSVKPVLEGVSRGGLFVYHWASRNPTRISCIYCDTPVCSIQSWPGGMGKGIGSPATWKSCLAVYGLSEEEGKSFQANPIDVIDPIAKEKIPILHIVSENDRVVPPDENTYLLKSALEKRGGTMEIISVPLGTKKSQGHHFTHPEPEKVIAFILQHSSGQQSTKADRPGK